MKKAIRIILSLLGAVIVVVLGLYFNTHVNSIFAKNYLAEKYNVEKSKIQYIDGRAPTIIWHNNGNIIGEPEWVDMSIKYKMNDREFFVQRIDFKFYDDYQIYDIEELATKWLQENIDESINGIRLESRFIYEFQKLSDKNRMLLFSSNNIDVFLEYCLSYDDKDYNTCVYHNNKLKNDYSDQICKKIKSKYNLQNEVYVCFKDVNMGYGIYNANSYWEISTITMD